MNNKKSTFKSSMQIWKRILSYVHGSKIVFVLIYVMYALGGTAGSYNRGMLLKNITKGTIEGNTSLILSGVITFALLSITLSLFSWLVGHIYVSKTKMKAEYKIRTDLFYHILNRPISRDSKEHSGDSLARLISDSDSVANALSWDTLSILWPISSFISCGIITLFINWKIGIMTLMIGTLFLYFTNKVATPMRENNKKIKEASSTATQRLLDFLSASSTVRIMGIEIPIIGRFEQATGEVKKMTLKNIMLNAWYSTLGSAVGIITTVSVLGYGLFLVSKGEIKLENVLLIYQFATSAVHGLVNIGRSMTRFQNSAASAQRVFELFDVPTEEKRTTLPSIEDIKKETDIALKIDNMYFKYTDDLDYAINDMSLIIHKGEHIALVGESGSGKSTFFKLLQGIYAIQNGELFIEGVNVKNISLKSQRACFSYVAQESPLFDGSIRDNIRMGKHDATDQEVEEAAIKANTHEFISAFPKGYESEVGELGVKISGGQKQRIAITRAIIHDTPILLLDEATSSLDSASELQIQSAIQSFSKNRTMIVAAHRLSTIKESDRILVFDKGSIIESGKHEELLSMNGLYAKLVMSQKLV